jgi:hypothetical protein
MNECHCTTRRVARKVHRCSECWGAIRAGETYIVESGIQDGPFAYKMCGHCHPLFVAANELSWKQNGEGLPFNGGLMDDIFESMGEPERMRGFIANMVRRGSEVRVWMWKRWREKRGVTL